MGEEEVWEREEEKNRKNREEKGKGAKGEENRCIKTETRLGIYLSDTST